MRHITQEGRLLIQHFEGFSDRVYLCPAGYPTIGYGHLIRDSEKFPQPISHREAETLLIQDVFVAERAVLGCIHVPLQDSQFNALVSFTFNLGGGALERSTLRQKINRGEHQAVPEELERWVYALGKKSPGLIARRRAEARMYANYRCESFHST